MEQILQTDPGMEEWWMGEAHIIEASLALQTNTDILNP